MSTSDLYQKQVQTQDLAISDLVDSERSPQLDKVSCRDRKTCICSSSSDTTAKGPNDTGGGGGGIEGGGGDVPPTTCIPCWRDGHPVSPNTRPFCIDDTDINDFDTLSTTSDDDFDSPNHLSNSTAHLSNDEGLELSKVSLDPLHHTLSSSQRIPSQRTLDEFLTYLNQHRRLGFLPSDSGEHWPPAFTSPALMSPLSASMHVDHPASPTPDETSMTLSIAALSSASPMSGTSSTFLACNGTWIDERKATPAMTASGTLRPAPTGQYWFVGWPIYLGHETNFRFNPLSGGEQGVLEDGGGAGGMEESMCGWSVIQVDEADFA